MNCSRELAQKLETLCAILIRCFILVFALVLLWFLFFLLGGEWAFDLHSRWFPLALHEYVLLNYYGIAFLKICNIFFFLVPYVAIRWFLKSSKRVSQV